MAAMLDMAFQLLAFFILTFKASPIEAQIALRLPDRATKTAGVDVASTDESLEIADFDLALTIELFANEDGSVQKILIGSHLIDGSNGQAEAIKNFRLKMRELFEKPLCDSIVVRVQKDLQYEPLMQVIDVCTKLKTTDGSPMSKISIVSAK